MARPRFYLVLPLKHMDPGVLGMIIGEFWTQDGADRHAATLARALRRRKGPDAELRLHRLAGCVPPGETHFHTGHLVG